MRTLYVRNVPDEVVERLEELARRERSSVNAVVVRELGAIARRQTNAELFASMPATEVTTAEILAAIDAGRR